MKLNKQTVLCSPKSTYESGRITAPEPIRGEEDQRRKKGYSTEVAVMT